MHPVQIQVLAYVVPCQPENHMFGHLNDVSPVKAEARKDGEGEFEFQKLGVFLTPPSHAVGNSCLHIGGRSSQNTPDVFSV